MVLHMDKFLALYSLSGKMSYRQISWSLGAMRLDVIMIVLLWNLHFSIFMIYWISPLVISQIGNSPGLMLIRHQSDMKVLDGHQCKGLYKQEHICINGLGHYWLNSSPPNATFKHQWIRSALVQIMACHLFGAKPLSKPMSDYYQLDP